MPETATRLPNRSPDAPSGGRDHLTHGVPARARALEGENQAGPRGRGMARDERVAVDRHRQGGNVEALALAPAPGFAPVDVDRGHPHEDVRRADDDLVPLDGDGPSVLGPFGRVARLERGGVDPAAGGLLEHHASPALCPADVVAPGLPTTARAPSIATEGPKPLLGGPTKKRAVSTQPVGVASKQYASYRRSAHTRSSPDRAMAPPWPSGGSAGTIPSVKHCPAAGAPRDRGARRMPRRRGFCLAPQSSASWKVRT